VNYDQEPEDLFEAASLFLWKSCQDLSDLRRRVCEHDIVADLLAFQWERFRSKSSRVCNYTQTERPQVLPLFEKDFLDCWCYVDVNAKCSEKEVEPAKESCRSWKGHQVPPVLELCSASDTLVLFSCGLRLGVITHFREVKYLGETEHRWGLIAENLNCTEAQLRHSMPVYSEMSDHLPKLFSRWFAFAINNGGIGLCFLWDASINKMIEIGDVVVLIFGATTPLILRKDPNEPNEYMLVTVCMLSNEACGCFHSEPHDGSQYESFRLSSRVPD
jgi:hypothetical protein